LLRVSSNGIKDNINSSQRLLESVPFIVHNSFSTQTSDVVQIGGGGGRDYLKTSLLGQLYGVRANVARGPMDEYGLPRRYVGIRSVDRIVELVLLSSVLLGI
jgi:hypothetical protein